MDDEKEIKDIIKASPLKDGCFDTVVVLTGDDAEAVSLAGTRIGRVKVLFHLPKELKLIGAHKYPAPPWWPKGVLAYLGWYIPPVLSASDQGAHSMATVKKAPLLNDAPPWSIIPLANICQSCMLIPRNVPSDSSWTSNIVLDKASSFLINNWSSIYILTRLCTKSRYCNT